MCSSFLANTTMLMRCHVQMSGSQKERSNQDYMHDPDNPPRPLLKRRTVGLQELTTPAAAAQPAGEHPSRAGTGARAVSLANETPEQRDRREEVQVGHFSYMATTAACCWGMIELHLELCSIVEGPDLIGELNCSKTVICVGALPGEAARQGVAGEARCSRGAIRRAPRQPHCGA